MSTTTTFEQLGLPENILSALIELGYETPTPIQDESIPVLLNGEDLSAQAQTGTGKTAAFALPILAKIKLDLYEPQALIIAPTRELAIQVAEACQSYAKHLKDFHVAPIYGGQDYKSQLRALKRGSQIIVGTPGRLMDHMRRGSLGVKHIQHVVLDEADEMLKMGFIDDIQWILEQIPHQHQTALFSATMPKSIQEIAKRYLKNAKRIHIQPKENTVAAIEQSFIKVTREEKLDALTRYLEVEQIQAAIIFSRTKTFSMELAEKLQARGYSAAALNGDMKQSQREKVIERIKRGTLDIIIATDVAARGIDVERISHVINYDIPYDSESYIHRIGRTGRAGRSGKAVSFITPREQRLLRDIEKAIHAQITQITPPSSQEVYEIRTQQLSDKVLQLLQGRQNFKSQHQMINKLIVEENYSPNDIAAALAYLVHHTQTTDKPQQSAHRENKEYKEKRESKGSREGRERREGRPSREGRENREGRPSREGRESREGRPSREGRESREGRPSREGRENREGRPSREGREGREGRPSREGGERKRSERSDRAKDKFASKDKKFKKDKPEKSDSKAYKGKSDRKDTKAKRK